MIETAKRAIEGSSSSKEVAAAYLFEGSTAHVIRWQNDGTEKTGDLENNSVEYIIKDRTRRKETLP